MQLGVVVNLLQRNKIIPETSFTYRSIAPFNENDILERTAHLFSLNLSNRLSKKFILNYNFRYKVHSDKSTATQYVSSLGYSINNKFQLFVENNGEFSKKDTIMVGGILTWRFKTT